MVLRPNGAVLRRRGKSVFLPWTAFYGIEQSRIADDSWWIFRMPARAIEFVVQSQGGVAVKCRNNVRTSQFFFRKDGQAIIANLYALQFGETVSLLLSLGKMLGSASPAFRPAEEGEFLDHDFY